MAKWRATVPVIIVILMISIITTSAEEDFEKATDEKGRILSSEMLLDTVTECVSFVESQVSVQKANIERAQLPDSKILKVPMLSQNPELPTGCESVALSILLMYDGYELTKTTIADQYLIYSETGTFEDGFIGNPHTYDGAGCFPATIVKTANRYLKDQGDEETALDLTGEDFDTLLHYVAAGRPVAVWSSLYLLDPQIDRSYSGDQDYTWYDLEHCVVLAGYDLKKGTVTVSDPVDGIVERDLSRFKTIYDKVGRYAVVIL